MDADLARLVRERAITRTLAEQRASVPEELKRLLGRPGVARRPRRHRPTPAYTRGGLADGRRHHLRLPGHGRRRDRHRRRGRGRVEGPGHRAAAPARADRPRRQRKERAVQTRGHLVAAGRASTCASWRSSRASSRPWSPPGCRCCAPCTPSRSRPRTSGSARRWPGFRPMSRPAARWSRRWSATPRSSTASIRAMVRSGEQSGRLEDALDRSPIQVEKSDALRRQVKSALMYPALIFGFAVVVLVAVVAFVIPVFVGIFDRSPKNTRAKLRLAAPDADLRHRLGRDHRLLVHPDPGPDRGSSSSSSNGSGPTAATSCGTASRCAFRPKSAT